MSATITPTAPPPAAPPSGPPSQLPRRRAGVGDGVLGIALLLLMLAALIPIRSVFIGSEWVRPVVAGVVLSLGIGWGARRLGVGPITHLAMTTVSLLVFVTIAFLPDTAVAGLLPTGRTLASLQDLFVRGLELVELRPSPTFAEAGLLLLAVAGTWIVAYLADGMLFVLRGPGKTVVCALVLWAVPLAVAPQTESIVVPAVTMLVAVALMLVLAGVRDSARFGVAVSAARDGGGPTSGLAVPALTVTASAIVLALLFAPVLPGFRAEPLYTARGGSGTTITTNPIVDIRQRLVASNTGPVVQVTSDRPVYLRTTSLDTYDENEQWTAGTISGQRVSGVVDTPPAVPVERQDVGIEVGASIEAGAVLAPAPYQPIEVSGPKAEVLRYDRRSATFTVPAGEALVAGDSYQVAAAIAQPSIEALRAVPTPGTGSAGTELPANVPDEVVALARQIVDDAGAQTMFDAALAIQDRLRTWSYSIEPQPGLGATAMLRFIDSQEGYCEQFAGTMAVMLRTLGIPSRLAVGYTPGDLQPDGRWLVTNGNAHAWVEVDFGALGWVTFEPTPRTDGNVLVTSSTAVVPSLTQAQQAGTAGTPADPVGPGDLNDVRPTPPLDRQDPLAMTPTAVPQAGAPGTTGPRVLPWVLLLSLVTVGGVAAVVLVRSRRDEGGTVPPEVRIDRARARVERLGRAMGHPRVPSETDEEYLGRIGHGHASALTLARPATRAVYAPAVTGAEAAQAEEAATALEERMTRHLTRWRKALVELRSLLAR